jgi:ribosomal protein L34E
LTLLEVGVAKDRPAVVIKFPVPQGTVEQPTATSIICLDCLQKKMCNIHTEEQTYMHLG